MGELLLGNLRQRETILSALRDLPHATAATDDEVLGCEDRQKLFGAGIGTGDAHLLAAASLKSGTSLWTQDKRLSVAAEKLKLPAR